MQPYQSDIPARLRLLNRAIEGSPEAAVNYVLRGEYWLEMGNAEAARVDFEKAIEIEQVALARSDWGYLQQALLDRAEHGLRQARSLLF
jgi:tetratricopeptide (TPR) repeat protein